MKFTEDYLDSELKLRDEFDRIKEDQRIPKKERSDWGRVFFFYELSRELLIHWLGEKRYEENIAFKIAPKPIGMENTGRFLLHGIQALQRDLMDNFKPWKKLSFENQSYLVSALNDLVESTLSSRKISLVNYASTLRKGDQSFFKTFEDYFRLKNTSVWLIAEFDLLNVDNWDRQFQNWKQSKLNEMGIKQERPAKKGSETIGQWLDQISRVRILREANWDIYKAHMAPEVQSLKPTKTALWDQNLKSVEEHIFKLFSIRASFKEPAPDLLEV